MRMELVDYNGILALWEKLEPLVAKCILRACKGEITPTDVLYMVLRKEAVMMVGFGDKDQIELMTAWEPVDFPQLKTINLFAMAGASPGVMRKYISAGWFDKIKAWAMAMGYQAIDCWTSESMQRIVRRYGFEQQYIHSRCLLGGAS